MRKIKLVLWIIILGSAAVFVFQNVAYFQETHSFDLDLMFIEKIRTPEMANGAYYMMAVVLGMLIAYIASLPTKIKSKKAIKNLNVAVDTHQGVIANLENELQTIKKETVVTPPPVAAPVAAKAAETTNVNADI